MKRLLLCCGVCGSREGMDMLLRLAAARKPDAVLFAGDILSPERRTVARATPWDLTMEDERFVHSFVGALGGLVTCAEPRNRTATFT